MKNNILVTGCGGDIGQSIGKVLNNKNSGHLFGCDISSKNAGKFIFKNFSTSLKCNDENYISSIEKFISANNINLLIPVSEPELRFLTHINKLDKIGNATMICPNKKALQIGFDKLETANFLSKHGFPFPKTELIDDLKGINKYPKIIKSRTGSGSSSIYIARDIIDFNYLKSKNKGFIVQEYLSSKEGEFTCGVFRSKAGEIRTIQLKRELTGGYSGYGEVTNHSEIEKLLINIAKKLELVGSINVQLRLTKKGPTVFEINPRFSSTVLFRDMLGFNDLIWAIQDKTNQEIDAFTKIESGKKFYKGFSEYID